MAILWTKLEDKMNIISKTLEFDSKNLLLLMEILGSYGVDSRIIGGCVRDKLLGLPSYDIDIATQLRPEQVISLLAKQKIKAIPTGVNFGTVTAMVGDETFEITSLRKDIKCDGRHAIVEFTEDFALDAERRDFTINALSYSLTERKIYDYCNGLEDMKAGKVRFIGKPMERIEEDYLRILRFFRFSARYSNEIDEAGLEASIASKDKLLKLPRERINMELDKLLGAKNAASILESMIKGGVDALGGLELNPMPISVSGLDLSSLYAILLLPNGAEVLKHSIPPLRFSRKRVREIVDLVSFMQNSPSLADFMELWIDGADAIQYLLVALNLGLIKESDAEVLKSKFKMESPILPVNGDDLSSRFSGHELGDALLKIKKAWIESGLTADKTALMEIL